MSTVVFTCFCSLEDADEIATILRDIACRPVHQRREDVYGRDFGDAGTGERVIGALARMAIELELAPDQVSEAVDALRNRRRTRPVRWRVTPILEGGRIE